MATRDSEHRREPIAVLGIGCRFPGAAGPEAFWRLLRDAVDAVTEVPASRIGLGRWGGFLPEIDRFDAAFFGISPREAIRMDPQQRILLEIAWEALEDAGQIPGELADSDGGVFLGISSDDYRELAGRELESADLHLSMGGARGVAAGRLSHFFGLTGPSLAVDTDRSASLVAVHLACQSLRSGECTLALAGGVNLILRPATGAAFAKAGLLAADGRCKAFSAAADGIVRSEGAGLVVLKPLAQALADGDPVRAVLRGSAVNNDGSGLLMTPSRAGQEAVLRAAWRNAGLSPGQADFVEAHGTGTPAGDRVEAEALAAVIGADRSVGQPCLVGSVKTNIGHAEAAAGIAGLIKTVLSLEHRTIPASLHCGEPISDIPWGEIPLAVAAEARPWPQSAEPFRAGVSSFGIAGTNAHAVLEEAPVRPETAELPDGAPVLIPLSARHPQALADLARTWRDWLRHGTRAGLGDIAYTAAARRRHHEHRLAVAARTIEDLDSALEAFLRGAPHPGLSTGSAPDARRRVVLVFPGHGACELAAGRGLLEQEPVFRSAFERCEEAIRRQGGEAEAFQPFSFSFQVALAELWRSWGVAPDAVVGHSLGEVAAACVAGALDLDDAARVVVERSRAVDPVRGRGGMAVAELPPAAAQELVAGCQGVEIAGSNSPGSTLFSGDLEALEDLVATLSRRDVFARRVRIDYASHSPAMDPVLPGLRRSLTGVKPRSGAVPFHSSVAGRLLDGAVLDAGYWMDNLRQPVRFSEAVQGLLETGHDLFLEIADRPVLSQALRAGFAAHGGKSAAVVASLRRGEDEHEAMLASLGSLHVNGAEIDWRRFHRDAARCVALPSYPWQRERFWFGEEPCASGTPESFVQQEEGTGGRMLAELRRRVAAVLRIPPEKVDADRPPTALGLDSLMALELRHGLEGELGIVVSTRDLLSGRTLAEIAAGLEPRLRNTSPPAPLPSPTLPIPGRGENLHKEDPSETLSARALPSPGGGRKGDGRGAGGEVLHAAEVPLSSGQQALWFLHRLTPESAACNLALGLRIASPLDQAALRRAFEALMARHPALRARFSATDEGEPRQRILPRPAADFAVLDATGGPDAVRRRLEDEAHRPFSLAGEPPVRLRVASWGADATALLLIVHHIVADFASLCILGRELGALYLRETGGPAALPAATEEGYREHPRREQRLLVGDAEERLWSYWQDELRDAPSELTLPLDRPRPPVQGFRGAMRSLRLGVAAAGAVRSYARARGTTLFTVLLAAFQALLHRSTGQDDVLVGSPASLRRPDLDGTAGYFVNPLVLRSRLAGDPSFDGFLEQTRRAALDALDHRDFPFPVLVERLGVSRDASRSPLFQAMFAFEQAERPEEQGLAACLMGLDGVPMSLGGLPATSLRIAGRASQMDLTLTMAPLDGDADGDLGECLCYDSDLFHDVTIQRMLERFRLLLAAAVASPGLPLSALPVMAPEERHQLLVEPDGAGAPLPAPACLPDLFAAQARRTPDAVALVAGAERLSYRELRRQSLRLAGRLRGLGVGPEVLVGLYVERGLSLVIGMLAILEAGGAYVPLDPAHPRERLALLAEDSGMAVLLTRSELAGRLPATSARIVFLDQAPEPSAPAPGRAPRPCPGNLAYLIYTSGSTGRPKGVAIEHRSAAALMHWAHRAFSASQLAGVLAATSIGFDLSVFEIFVPLCVGGTVLLAENALRLPELPARGEVTLVNTVPSALAELLRLDALPPAARTVNLAGEPLPRALADALFARGTVEQLWNLYGPSEDTTYSTSARIEPGDPRAPAIGRALDGSQAYVLDQRLQPVPLGVAGEIFLGGAGLARGYLGRPDLTAWRFIPDPFAAEPGGRLYRTGDRARLRPDGSLDFLGRLDHQVKIRGFRIEPGEVEAALRRHPRLRAALVMAREDIPGHRQLVAYAVPDPAVPPSPAELKAFLHQDLPDYMVPSFVVLLEALPLNPNGKVDRKALPRPQQQLAESAAEEGSGARTPVQETLARLWTRVLRLERVGLHDDFFALGGDSILGIQIVAQAAREKLRLSPQDFFRCKTIARLAEAAEVVEPAAAPRAEQGEVTGPMPLTPIQRWFLDGEPAEPWHFNQAVLLEVQPTALETSPPWPPSPIAPPTPGRGGNPAGLLERALSHLLRHHDALRLRFVRTDDGWEQTGMTYAGPVPFSWINLSGLPAAAGKTALETACAALQASLDLTAGPLLRAAWIEMGAGRPARLLLAVHHLAVDGVSWRVLLADLEAACLRLAAGETVELPPKTTSFQAWARALAEHSRSAELRREIDTWRAVPRVAPLPQDGPGARREDANTRASARTVSVSLSAAETRRLLRDVPAAYRTRINDVLLAALGLAFARWTGEPALWLDLEGHGREEIAPGLDLSRTVGWFTSMFPVALEIEPAAGPAAALKAVKERLRALPRHGIGFGLLRFPANGADELADLPPSEVCFNYLGQLDAWLDGSTLFSAAAPAPGPCQSRRGLRSHALELNGWIAGSRLRLAWTYSANLHRSATVKGLARAFLHELRGLIDHCAAAGAAAGYTPSDFPLAGLDQQSLDALLGGERGIESLDPLTPLQEGVLFHTLCAPQTGAYVQQVTCSLRGALDEAVLRRAWEHLAARHSALRAAFAWKGLERPLQIVRSQVELPWESHDWRGLPAGVQEERLRKLLDGDRRRGFDGEDVERAPLLRFTLVRLSDSTWRLLWTHHHILLDGWSIQILLGELLRCYESLQRGAAWDAEPPRPFRDFVAWLQGLDLAPAEAFWRHALAGIDAPTPLPLACPDSPLEGSPERSRCRLRLSEKATAALSASTRSRHLTLNTLVQGAWALVLGRCSGMNDVLFGTTTAGRPASLPGAETTVGLFINTLPLRVRIHPEAAVLPWLQSLQDHLVEVRQHEHTPLVRAREWSGMPSSRALFESLLVFESYPPAPAHEPGPVSLEDVHFLESPHYPLTVVAVPGPRLLLQAIHDPARLDRDAAGRLLEHLRAALEALAAADPARRLAAVLAAAGPAAPLPARTTTTTTVRTQDRLAYRPPERRRTSRLGGSAEVERAIASIWRESLRIDQIGRDDSFFDAGGNSLLLFRVHGMMRQRLGCDLSIGDLLDHPTISGLARHLAGAVETAWLGADR